MASEKSSVKSSQNNIAASTTSIRFGGYLCTTVREWHRVLLVVP